MNLQSEDKSNKALTVGSLNVLDGMKSDELTAIHTHLQTQDGVQSRIIADMEKLYQSISADGVITANEKQMLKKELTIIETEYPIILTKAEAAKKEKADIDTYKEAFQKLYHYIYSELKVFDSMQTPLDIERTTFNAIFAAYYSSRALLQINKDGLILFTWIKFAKDAHGTDMNDYPDGGRHWMGIAYNKLTAEESDNPADYTWIDVQGKQGVPGQKGDQGIAGTPGKDGKTRFIWVKYANDAKGTGMSDKPDGKDYIGFAFNKDSAAESNNPADYHWQKVRGMQGIQGIPGKDGTTKFLPSLATTGDYENQIGTFQGRLYRWTAGKWVLLNAVMPLNPVAHYDMADVQSQDSIFFELSKPIIEKRMPEIIGGRGLPVRHKKGTYYRIHSDVSYSGNAMPVVIVYRADWAEGTIILWEPLIGVQDFTVFVPQHPLGFGIGVWMHGWGGYEVHPDDSVTVHKFTVTEIKEKILIDSSGSGNHSTAVGGVEKAKDDKIGTTLQFNNGYLSRPPQNFIGVGKQWSHSRWIKMNGDAQDKTKNPRLWYYGLLDYCYTDISVNNGNMDTINIVTYKTNPESIGISISKINIADDKWHNLVVCNDLQPTYARKIVYLDGELIKDTTVNGDFTGLVNNVNYDMSAGNDYVKGSLANLLFFDRLLTEQEVLYLYLNPQYPVKNYTLTDWAIDPANPDSNIKNLTPKYRGVTETVPTTRTVLITKGERLGAQDANAGDWVLMGKTVGGWKVGVCYRWTGRMWINLEPEYNYTEQYQAALYHICEIPELMKNTGHFGALFAKVLVAQQAFIDKLVAQEAFIKKLATEQAFLRQLIVQRLHIDSDDTTHQDFEAWFDKDNGLKIKNEDNVIFRIAPDGNILMGNNIFFKHLPYWIAGRPFCSEAETVKSFCERNGFDTFNALGTYGGKTFNKIQTTKTEKHKMWCLCFNPRGLEPSPFWEEANLKTVKYTLTLYDNAAEIYTIYYKDYPDMPYVAPALSYWNFKKNGYWSKDANDVYIPQQTNDTLNFIAYIGVKQMNYVMTIENIPTQKPKGSGIVWKDGNFLKIS